MKIFGRTKIKKDRLVISFFKILAILGLAGSILLIAYKAFKS